MANMGKPGFGDPQMPYFFDGFVEGEMGQVLFVPREEVVLRDGTEDQIAARRLSSEAFFREKAGARVKTAYGMEYSPHYSRTSRRQSAPGRATPPLK